MEAADFFLRDETEDWTPTTFSEPTYYSFDSGPKREQESSSFSQDNREQNITLPRKRGRQTDKLTMFLANFIRGRSRRPLKAEYLYAQMIRRHQKTIRSVAELGNSEQISVEANTFWQDLVDCYKENSQVFNFYCSTDFSPHSELRKQSNSATRFRSFNKDFCKEYFENPLMRKSFHYFVNYLFVGSDPNFLSDLFRANCCLDRTHGPNCNFKWNELKRYIQEYFMTRLDLEPFFVEDNVPLVFQGYI